MQNVIKLGVVFAECRNKPFVSNFVMLNVVARCNEPTEMEFCKKTDRSIYFVPFHQPYKCLIDARGLGRYLQNIFFFETHK